MHLQVLTKSEKIYLGFSFNFSIQYHLIAFPSTYHFHSTVPTTLSPAYKEVTFMGLINNPRVMSKVRLNNHKSLKELLYITNFTSHFGFKTKKCLLL